MVIHELRERLHGLAADILFLQEVQGVARRGHAARYLDWPVKPQHEFIADYGLARGRVRQERDVRSTAITATRVLSRFPIVAHENSDISAHAFESRGLLHCAIEPRAGRAGAPLPQRPPRAVRARAASGRSARCASGSARRCRDDAPLIIAGDFNDWRHKANRHARRRARRRRGVRRRARASGAHVPVGDAGVPPRSHLRARARRSSTRASTTRSRRRRISDHAALAATFDTRRRRGRDEPVPPGQRDQLCCGAEASTFPALVDAIDGAEREVWLETYIFADDDVGADRRRGARARRAARRRRARARRRLGRASTT